ncbi:MAG: hypothetical protein RL722_2934, partial [Pseudomonadota bacterium]
MSTAPNSPSGQPSARLDTRPMPERLQQLGREKATLMAALRAAWAPAES